jgi:glycosyltransferase involved in cell wall biosynthesis
MPARPTPLSIVHLLAPAPFGGLETVVECLAAGQARAGDRVSVAVVLSGVDGAHPFVSSLRGRGLEVDVLSIGARQYLRERRSVRELLGRRRAQVLHTHGYRPDVVDAPVARRLGVRTVTTVHGFTARTWRGRLYERLQTRALRRFDAVIAVSPLLGRALAAAGVGDERLHTLQNAWEASTPFVPRAQARAALGLPAEGPIVAWVGRMSPEKAPDVMVRCLLAAATPELRLSMIGTGSGEAEARALAEGLHVAPRIRWHGRVGEAASLLKAFDAIVLTSWTEGTPMILLEAMAAEVPVVSTAVGGVPEVVTDLEARLAPAGDVAALGAAIDEVLADGPSARTRAQAAKRRLDTGFAVEPWVRRHQEIYRSVLEAE